MAFDGTSQGTDPAARPESRYLGEGFRPEPDFRDATTTPLQPTPVPSSDNEEPDATLALNSRRLAPPNLEYVFDDPAEGEPGRDRMLVHGLWELILAIALVGAGYLFYREVDGAFGGDDLRRLLVSTSVLGALAVGSALALRTGAANLAVGAVAVAASLYFAQNSGGGLFASLTMVIGVCAIIGAVQGLMVVGLQVPGWAASLGVGLALVVWTNRQAAAGMPDGYDPLPHAYLWFGGVAGFSIVSALVGLIPTVRRAVGRFRPVADPAQRRGIVAALITLGAVVVSTVLAGVAGVLLAASTEGATPSDGLELTALAIGAALLGGTSAFGRRGGIFGTMLAAGLLTIGVAYAQAAGRNWPAVAFAAAAIGLGLAVTRLVERYGRPARGDEDIDESDWSASTQASDGWTTSRQPTGIGGLWTNDEAWGSSDRR